MAPLAVASTALLVSLSSFIVSFRAFRLAQRQDDRRRPSLVPSLLNGYVQFRKEGRAYAFLLSISNTSDSNNAVAKIELHLTYKRSTGEPLTVQLPASHSREDAFIDLTEFTPLATPARLDAHQTLVGWSLFRVSKAILEDAKVEAYSVALFDSHDVKATVEPIMIQELISETVSPVREDSAPQ